MPKIVSGGRFQTVITTFEVTPGTAHDLLDELVDAHDKVISRQPGFIGSAIHVNDAQTRIASYSQWHRRACPRCAASPGNPRAGTIANNWRSASGRR